MHRFAATLALGALVGGIAVYLAIPAAPLAEAESVQEVDYQRERADLAERKLSRLRADMDAIQFAKAERERADMAPVPPAYREYVGKASQEFGVPVAIIARLGERESRWNGKAVGDLGEQGCLQLFRSTAQDRAKELGLTEFDLMDPATNIRLGVAHLRWAYDQEGSWDGALSRYNGGGDWRNKGDTRDYAASILGRAVQK